MGKVNKSKKRVNRKSQKRANNRKSQKRANNRKSQKRANKRKKKRTLRGGNDLQVRGGNYTQERGGNDLQVRGGNDPQELAGQLHLLANKLERQAQQQQEYPLQVKGKGTVDFGKDELLKESRNGQGNTVDFGIEGDLAKDLLQRHGDDALNKMYDEAKPFEKDSVVILFYLARMLDDLTNNELQYEGVYKKMFRIIRERVKKIYDSHVITVNETARRPQDPKITIPGIKYTLRNVLISLADFFQRQASRRSGKGRRLCSPCSNPYLEIFIGVVKLFYQLIENEIGNKVLPEKQRKQWDQFRKSIEIINRRRFDDVGKEYQLFSNNTAAPSYEETYMKLNKLLIWMSNALLKDSETDGGFEWLENQSNKDIFDKSISWGAGEGTIGQAGHALNDLANQVTTNDT